MNTGANRTGGHRVERIAEEIRNEVSLMLAGELKDPRLAGTVMITEVRVTPDLRTVRVYVSLADEDETERASTLAGLQAAKGYVRHELVERLQLRRAPEVLFILDQSEEIGDRIDQLLRNVKKSGEIAEDVCPGNHNLLPSTVFLSLTNLAARLRTISSNPCAGSLDFARSATSERSIRSRPVCWCWLWDGQRDSPVSTRVVENGIAVRCGSVLPLIRMTRMANHSVRIRRLPLMRKRLLPLRRNLSEIFSRRRLPFPPRKFAERRRMSWLENTSR